MHEHDDCRVEPRETAVPAGAVAAGEHESAFLQPIERTAHAAVPVLAMPVHHGPGIGQQPGVPLRYAADEVTQAAEVAKPFRGLARLQRECEQMPAVFYPQKYRAFRP